MTDAQSDLKLLSELKAAIEVDIADSEAGSFADFTSKEALSVHLDVLPLTEN